MHLQKKGFWEAWVNERRIWIGTRKDKWERKENQKRVEKVEEIKKFRYTQKFPWQFENQIPSIVQYWLNSVSIESTIKMPLTSMKIEVASAVSVFGNPMLKMYLNPRQNLLNHTICHLLRTDFRNCLYIILLGLDTSKFLFPLVSSIQNNL